MGNQGFILAVQGEGRGHLMQALTVYQLLTDAGHEVCCIVVGMPSDRSLPAFFCRRVISPVVCLPSPGFAKHHGRSISLWRTLWCTLWRLPEYISSIRRFHRLVSFHQPEAIVNFYEPLAGLYRIFYRHSARSVSIAHQYVYLHEGFEIPGAGAWQRLLLSAFTRLTAAGSDRLLALSIPEMPPSRDSRLRVVPPILRRDLLSILPADEGFLLVYLVNAGYMSDIVRWHEANPNVTIHCFTDASEVRDLHKGHYRLDANLSFHSIDDRIFLEMLATCSAVATSAGFETVCEALLLGKPILMVPVEGHQEQLSNALDMSRQGLAVWSHHYDLDRVAGQDKPSTQFREDFRRRVREMHSILLTEITGGSANVEGKVVEMTVRLVPEVLGGNA